VLGEKIESQSEVQRSLDLGIDLFQGYYFARPEIISGKRLDPSKAALLRLLSMTLSDATDSQIEAELKRHPQFIFNLLSIVNSVAYGTGRKITSLSECLLVLGRRQLRRWVQLLLYAVPHRDMAEHPLLHTAATRARLLEILAQRTARADSEGQDRAFLVGILSLLDVLWQVPMSEVVNQMPIDTKVKEALTSRRGWDGKILSVIESHEAGEVATVEDALKELPGMTMGSFVQTYFESIVWADQLSAT
jgi:EAL and modified HD-GYP domain-containing signal transduction protein